MQCLRLSSCNRAVGSTEMNAESSRSHMVCRLTVQQFAPKEEQESNASSTSSSSTASASTSTSTSSLEEKAPSSTSQLTFVDLAGSERLKKTMATGNRKKEGIAINKGLFHLGRVINANALGKNDPYIYRASKLTRLLQDALGGNSKTLFIACVSPAESNTEETLSTLRYANAAKNIQNTAIVNRSPHEVQMLRASVKLEAMTFEYVRLAHGDDGKKTKDDIVYDLLAQSDLVQNDVQAILTKALENRDDLKMKGGGGGGVGSSSSSGSSSSGGSGSHQTNYQGKKKGGHRRARSNSVTNSTVNNSEQHSQHSQQRERPKRRPPSQNNHHHQNNRKNQKGSSSQKTKTMMKKEGEQVIEKVVVLTEEERNNSLALISVVEEAEKEMQNEYLMTIQQLEIQMKEGMCPYVYTCYSLCSHLFLSLTTY